MKTTTTIEVPSKYIAALMLFAGEKDIRQYINGICFEIGPTESRLIATDGARLVVMRVTAPQPDLATPIAAIVPRELLIGVKGEFPVSIEFGDLSDDNTRPVSVRCVGEPTRSARTLPGVYPDWRPVLPKTVSGEVAQFNSALVYDFLKAKKILSGNKTHPVVILGHNGNKAALVDIDHPDFCGCVMPMLDSGSISTAPEWAHAALDSLPACDLV